MDPRRNLRFISSLRSHRFFFVPFNDLLSAPPPTTPPTTNPPQINQCRPFHFSHDPLLHYGTRLLSLHNFPCTRPVPDHLYPSNTSPTGPIVFWAYIFYLSKIIEFLNTVLIILSNPPYRLILLDRLTSLQPGHHSMVVIMCYLWMESSQSLFPLILVTNALVQVLMYAYYLSRALVVRSSWRKVVTYCQILQFKASFVTFSVMICFHMRRVGCSGAWAWIYNLVF